MERFRRIQVDPAAKTVTAEAGAQWGDILTRTTAFGLVPYVMVTAHTTSAGGTLSSNSLSRFSPTLGREGLHVAHFTLMLPTGEILMCSREQNQDYFRTVVGGLGLVGAILSVTHRLLPLNITQKNIAVETQFTKDQGLESIARSLLLHLGKTSPHRPFPKTKEALARAAADPLGSAWAVSAVVYFSQGERGLIATSRYVNRPPNRLRRSVYHQPNSPLALALQIAALVPLLRTVGYFLAFLLSYKEPYFDELHGYTFFEDGNRNLRDAGRTVGLPMGIHQTTFIVPFDPGRELDADRSGSVLARFFTAARSRLRQARVSPTLIDVLFLPDDGGVPFALSSSNHLQGFAVTFTFEKVFSTRFAREIDALQRIGEDCAGLGGRVHLVKNVDALRQQVQDEYRAGIDALTRVRGSCGPSTPVGNDFSRRVGLE